MFTLNNPITPEDSFEIEKAILYLVKNYSESGHNSKPVILHSIRVANILMELDYEKKLIIGAILHDILEDTEVTSDQLKENFSPVISEFIMAVSFDKSITDKIGQYKEMYDRILVYGRDAVVLKAVDIAVNSLYINRVQDKEKQKQLIDKGTYFLNLTKDYANEAAWKLLKKRNTEELKRTS